MFTLTKTSNSIRVEPCRVAKRVKLLQGIGEIQHGLHLAHQHDLKTTHLNLHICCEQHRPNVFGTR